jgi:putative inorganic carbon (HCO3(-)) transporter
MGVREVIVAVITLVLCIFALMRPRIGLYGYVWFSLMRPEYLAYANGSIPYSPALAASVLLGSLRHFADFPVILRNPISRTLVLLQIPIVISVLLALVPALCYERFFAYERAILMVLLIPVLIRTVEQVRILFLVIALSLGVIGLKIGLGVLLHGGYHITEGYAFMENNQLAATFAIVIPFLWYARQTVESKAMRLALLAMLFGSMTTVILTTSRGGSLAMLTALILMISRSRKKVRNFALLALCMAPALFLFGSEFLARMETLKDATKDMSAYSRLVMYRAAMRI